MSAPILVGYDGTDGAKAALAEAVRLAGPLQAELVLVFARHLSRLGGEVADMAHVLDERATAILQEGLATASATGVSARIELVTGRAADALTELAPRLGAQLVVVGSHGEAPLRGLLIGSTPYRLLHQCPVPLVVVREADA